MRQFMWEPLREPQWETCGNACARSRVQSMLFIQELFRRLQQRLQADNYLKSLLHAHQQLLI